MKRIYKSMGPSGANGAGSLVRSSVLLALILTGCASPRDRAVFETWQQVERAHYAEPRAVVPELEWLAEGTLDAYLHYALRHNPALEASFNEWKAALEAIPQARSRPDPQLSFGYFISQIDSRADPRGETYGLSQMFPWFGKLQLRGEVALESALAAQQRFEAERLQIFERVAQAYAEYFFYNQSVAVVETNLELVTHLEEMARARFRADAAAHQDVIRAQVELGRLDDQFRSLQDLAGSVQANLNAALGRPAEMPLPPAPPREALEIEPGRFHFADQEALVVARQFNPELLALEHQAAAREQSIRLARRGYYPDVMLGVEYSRNADARMARMDGGGTDMLMGMVSINLPVWTQKYGAAVREAEAARNAAERQLEQRRLTMESELKQALYRFRDAERKIDLYGNTLIPMARQSLQVAETAYRAANGQADFLDLIDAQRVLIEFELARERALADHLQRRAQIERLTGRPARELPTTPASSRQEESTNPENQ
jgi:outer membrane protein, heavy metal efflux system